MTAETEATATHTRLTIVYRNWRGEVGRRTITPVSMRFGHTPWHPEKQWLISAFDHGKGRWREFALKDIGRPDVALLEALERAEKDFLAIRDLPSHGASNRAFIDWLRSNAMAAAERVRAALAQAKGEADG